MLEQSGGFFFSPPLYRSLSDPAYLRQSQGHSERVHITQICLSAHLLKVSLFPQTKDKRTFQKSNLCLSEGICGMLRFEYTHSSVIVPNTDVLKIPCLMLMLKRHLHMQARSPGKAFPLKDHFDIQLPSLEKKKKSQSNMPRSKLKHATFNF